MKKHSLPAALRFPADRGFLTQSKERKIITPKTTPRPAWIFFQLMACACLFFSCLATASAQLPPGWLGANVGSPSSGGETYDVNTQTFAITAVGMGIPSSPASWVDKGHFTYKQVSGDVEIVARVTSFDNSYYGQVGLVMRTGTGTGDQIGANFYWYAGGPNSLWLRTRGPVVDGDGLYYANQGSTAITKTGMVAPFWLKLVRIGNNYGSYWSPDGRDWFMTSNLSGGVFFAPGTYNIGFWVTSGSDTTMNTATFDNVYVGPPRLKYESTWVGSTSGGFAAGSASNQVFSLWVKPSDGTCYANGNWDESSMTGKLYKDGAVLHGFNTSLVSNNLCYEGGVTGNATNLFFVSHVKVNGVTTPIVYRTDFSTNVGAVSLSFSTPALGEVAGLAASATRIFVSDITNGLVRIVDATTRTEITPAIPFPHCGPIAYDGTNFWITQCASDLPLAWHTTGTYPPAIKCYTPAGADTGRSITDTALPTALAYDDRGTPGTTSDDRLWVCDNGPNQNVRYYTNLTGPGNPVFAGTFGQTGGIWSGSTPGKVTDPAAGGDLRFYGPTGVGVDSSGNVYVACNGGSFYVTDLRKFTSTGTLLWRQAGLEFINVGDFDPTSDGQQIYSAEKHYTMNYGNTAPGSEWNYTGFTRNVRQYPYDARNPISPAAAQTSRAQLQRLGTNNLLYMYTGGQGAVGTSWLYYFNGETAIPFGTNASSSTHTLWIDLNNNDVQDAGETTTAPVPGGTLRAFDVDSQGDIWMAYQGGLTISTTARYIRRIVCAGTRTIGAGGTVVPSYSLAAGGYIDYAVPAPLTALANLNYDRANDVLYAIGQKADGTWILVRCDKWLANPENLYNAKATYSVNLPNPATDLTIFYQTGQFDYAGLDVAGGKVFVAELYGPVHVYDAALGNPAIMLNPGPEESTHCGWEDMSMGVNAFKRSNGEYLITEEDSGIGANDLLYRWTPQADTAVANAPTQLAATAPGRKVMLSWAGSYGAVTSYNLYRSTSSGTETLYQSGLTSPAYVDLNVVPGTTYYYKVSAVNAVGESALSNEASATPISTQVEFVKTDTTTQGTWKTVYGADGYEICNNATSYPAYATVSAPNTTTGTWVASTTDVRALQKAATGSTDRIAAYRTSSTGLITWNVTFTDGKWHQVAIYMLDWTATRYSHVVSVLDAATGAVLDSRVMLGFSQGKYLVWNINGNVKIQVSEIWANDTLVASGLFFDPIPSAMPTLGWWKMDETSGTIVGDSSGAGNNVTTQGAYADSAGKINWCRNFTITPWIGFPASLLVTTTDHTFATWIKTTASGPILCTQDDPYHPPAHHAPLVYVGDDGKVYASYIVNTTTPMVSNTTVTDNAWHHIALVKSGNLQTLYVDGNVEGTLVAPIPTNYWYGWLGYGDCDGWPHISGTSAYYLGRMDDVRLYNRPLSTAEIGQLAHP